MTDDWQSQKFRQNVISKIHDLLPPNAPQDQNASVIENNIFQKSRTKEEYLGLVAKLFMHYKDMSRKSQQQQQQQQQQQKAPLPTPPRPVFAYWESILSTLPPERAAEVERKMTRLLWEEKDAS